MDPLCLPVGVSELIHSDKLLLYAHTCYNCSTYLVDKDNKGKAMVILLTGFASTPRAMLITPFPKPVDIWGFRGLYHLTVLTSSAIDVLISTALSHVRAASSLKSQFFNGIGTDTCY